MSIPRASVKHGSFQKAAELYSKVATGLPEDQQSLLPFEQWFYASLGAVDTNQIDEDRLVDASSAALIKKTIESCRGTGQKAHGSFCQWVFTKMTGVKPAAKFRYLKFAWKLSAKTRRHGAKKLYDYYNDLLTEIKLESVVDGSTVWVTASRFGIFVNLKHTREIERESGGLSNTCRIKTAESGTTTTMADPPPIIGTDFQDMVKEALKDQFELLSVTFQDERSTHRATPEFGWRFTPYAMSF